MTAPVFVAGNKRILYLGTQSAVGTAQTTPTKALRVTDYTPDETRARITLSETDATTQQSSDVIVGYQPGGSFKVYLRPDTAALLFKSLLGANADTGSTNYTHTITPSITTPYLTIYEVEPNSVWCRQFVDCRFTQIQLDGQTGGAIEATVTFAALSVADGATAPSSPTPASDLPYVYPEITVTRAGVHAGVVSQFTITIDRNGARAQGDNGFGSLDYVNGLFSVAGSFTQYASADTDMRQVDTGTTTGTVATTTIYEETLAIKGTRDANTSINIAIAAASYPSRTAAVDTSGAPLAEVLGFRSDPQTTLAANIVVTVHDQLATPDS
jgi:hypothetical protein